MRELREGQGLDVAVLARRLAISAAQLRQLEQNQSTLFYSDAIRLAAARKVSAYLGEPLLLTQALAPAPDAQPDLSNGGQPHGGQKQAVGAEAVPFAISEAPSGQVSLKGGAESAEDVSPSPEPQTMPQRHGLHPWPSALAGCALALALVLGWQWQAPEQLAVPQQAGEQAKLEQPAVPEAAAPTAEPTPDKTAAAAELAVVPGSAAAYPEPMRWASVSTDSAKTTSDAACGSFVGPADSFSPAKAVKDGSLVYVVGVPDQVVCLKDGQGKVSRHVFTAATGQSFYGTAPWLVESAQLGALQIFFQGARVRLGDSGSRRLRLVPTESL